MIALEGDTVIDCSVALAGLAGGLWRFVPPHETSSQKIQGTKTTVRLAACTSSLFDMVVYPFRTRLRGVGLNSFTCPSADCGLVADGHVA